jgi:hypothetical protein
MNKNIVVVIALVLLCFSQNLYAQVKPLPSNIEATWGEGQNNMLPVDDFSLLGTQGDYIYGCRKYIKNSVVLCIE